jgi:nucleoid-associated protein YgaU
MRSVSAFEKFGRFVPRSSARVRRPTVNESETLSGLAHRYYGDHTLWRLIAAANGITDARRLEPGANLIIPERPAEKGSYGSL